MKKRNGSTTAAAKKGSLAPRVGVLNPSREASARGSIIERFATLEALIDTVICSYYFGDHEPPREFQEDVLFDEGFSFGLRRTIFEKIFRREDAYDRAIMQDIHRMNRVRNEAAHRRAKQFGGDESVWEMFELANRVEKHFATKIVPKLRIRFHFDPLPTRQDLLKAASAGVGSRA
jgi:hypothetical protein